MVCSSTYTFPYHVRLLHGSQEVDGADHKQGDRIKNYAVENKQCSVQLQLHMSCKRKLHLFSECYLPLLFYEITL